MLSWSSKRQLVYLLIPLFLVLSAFAFFYFSFIYTPATCYDYVKNGDEEGVDCGGKCSLVCSSDILNPIVLWTKAFPVTVDVYNVVAYIQNPNQSSEAFNAIYTFRLYDETGGLLAERIGSTHIPKNKKFAVLESSFKVPYKVKTVDFQFTEKINWYKSNSDDRFLKITNSPIINENKYPKIEGSIKNESLETVGPVELVSVVFDGRGNAVGASRTLVDKIKKDRTEPFVFTWPKPFETGQDVCEISSKVMLVLDRSGSMASISKEPPEPLNSVKNTAKEFISLLRQEDVVGLVSFANSASYPIDQFLTQDFSSVKRSIDSINIMTDGIQNTNIGDGILKAKEELLSKNDGLQNIIVLLTDGDPTDPKLEGDKDYPVKYAKEISKNAKDSGISIYTIGLGNSINQDLLVEIAGSKDRYFSAPNTNTLSSIYTQIAKSICVRKPNVIEIIPNILGKR